MVAVRVGEALCPLGAGAFPIAPPLLVRAWPVGPRYHQQTVQVGKSAAAIQCASRQKTRCARRAHRYRFFSLAGCKHPR